MKPYATAALVHYVLAAAVAYKIARDFDGGDNALSAKDRSLMSMMRDMDSKLDAKLNSMLKVSSHTETGLEAQLAELKQENDKLRHELTDAQRAPTSSFPLSLENRGARVAQILRTSTANASSPTQHFAPGCSAKTAVPRHTAVLNQAELRANATSAALRNPCANQEIPVHDFRYGYAVTTCCPWSRKDCGGCAYFKEGKCQKCASGFVKRGERCVACSDRASWVDLTGLGCPLAACSNDKVHGASSNEACCKCGGGHVTATPFFYPDKLSVVGTDISLEPRPRTASRYELSSDCELAAHSLTLNGETGIISFGDGLARPKEPFHIQCEVTAHEADGVSFTTTVSLGQDWITYPSRVLMFPAEYSLLQSGGFEGLRLSCAPTAPWLRLASDGKLSGDNSAATGGVVAEGEAYNSQDGAICVVKGSKGETKGKASFLAIRPKPWTSMSYGADKVTISLGEALPILKPQGQGRMPPRSFELGCTSQFPDFPAVYDRSMQTVLVGGVPLIQVEENGGLVIGAPEELARTLDSIKVNTDPAYLEDGFECDYFYGNTECSVPDLGAQTPKHTEVVDEIFWDSGKWPKVQQTNNFCVRCQGSLVTKKPGSYKLYVTSDDCSMLYLDGKLVVDNDGCHGPLEKSSIEKFLSPGAHKLRVEMCERGGGETLKLQYSGPDTGNSKVKIPKSALKHAKAGKHVLEGDSYAKGPLVANEGPGVGDLLGGQSMDACNQMCDRISTCYSYALCGDNCHFKNRFVEPWDPRSTKDCRSVYKARKEAFMLNPGDVVALHNQHFNRFVSLKKKDGKLGLYVSPQWPVVDLKDTAEAERFVVMDAGNGEVALYNKHYKRFITMGSGVVSVSSETNDVPPGGVANLLPVVDLDGYVGFYSHQTGMFLQMTDQQVMKVNKVAPDQFATSNRQHYTWVKFQVLKAPPPSFGSGLASAMQVRCSIYGDFGEELAPVRTGLTIDIKDNVCWEKKKVKAAVTREDKGLPEEKCLSKCRMDKTCSHFWWTADSCKQYALRSSGADVTVWVKVPDCGQAAACLEVGGSQDYRTSGLYCPLGQDSHGRVFYQKKAPTLEDSFYMAKYRSDHGKCSTSEWVVQSPSSSDYLKSDVGYYELRGAVQSCVPAADVQVAARGCAKPQAFGPPEEGLPAFVIDDPSTEAPEDFWLHPCDCAPEAWGADLPMNPKTFETIPSGSSNQYIPAPYLIVEGQFACPTRQLRGLHRETETEVMEKADCEAICRMDEHCHLFWHGQQHGASVCRIFSGCDSLVRELGIEGALMAMPKRKLCQVVDAVTCWQTTLRRDYLTREHQVLKPGDTVGLYNEHSKQFVSMDKERLTLKNQDTGELPVTWAGERFTVVDAGMGMVAFHNSLHNRFIRISDDSMKASPESDVDKLDRRWVSVAFTALYDKAGRVALHSQHHGRFMKAEKGKQGHYDAVPGKKCKEGAYTYNTATKCDGFNGLTQEQCQQKCTDSAQARNCPKKTCQAAVFYKSGGWCHLYEACTGFVDRDATTMVKQGWLTVTGAMRPEELPSGWKKEWFKVVKVVATTKAPTILKDGDLIALYCTNRNRLVRMKSDGTVEGGPPRDTKEEVKDDWYGEPFRVVDAGRGLIALHNWKYNRFVKMSIDNKMQGSSSREVDELPSHWDAERYQVIDGGNGEIGLHNANQNRYIYMDGAGVMKRSEERSSDLHLPITLYGARFKVVEVKQAMRPGDTVALWNVGHKRFLRMKADKVEVTGKVDSYEHLPDDEEVLFKVVDAGFGRVALHSAKHNCFLKVMKDQKATCSPKKDADMLPAHWEAEVFTIVDQQGQRAEQIGLYQQTAGFLDLNAQNEVKSKMFKERDLVDWRTNEMFRVHIKGKTRVREAKKVTEILQDLKQMVIEPIAAQLYPTGNVATTNLGGLIAKGLSIVFGFSFLDVGSTASRRMALQGFEYAHLYEQCDSQMLLGGMGVETCSWPVFRDPEQHSWQHKRQLPASFQHGQDLRVRCWSERYAGLSQGQASAEETLKCMNGQWLGSTGKSLESSFSCRSCVQVAQPGYMSLDQRRQQELYYFNKMYLAVYSEIGASNHLYAPSKFCLEKAVNADPAYLEDGFECDYFYGNNECSIPDLGAQTPKHTEIVDEIFWDSGKWPKVQQTNNFCVRCQGSLVVKKPGKYNFYTTSDDGSMLYLDGKRIVDNNGCHGPQERASIEQTLSHGGHKLRVEMCERGGGETLKLQYSGPDTGNSKVKIPKSAVKAGKDVEVERPFMYARPASTCTSWIRAEALPQSDLHNRVFKLPSDECLATDSLTVVAPEKCEAGKVEQQLFPGELPWMLWRLQSVIGMGTPMHNLPYNVNCGKNQALSVLDFVQLFLGDRSTAATVCQFAPQVQSNKWHDSKIERPRSSHWPDWWHILAENPVQCPPGEALTAMQRDRDNKRYFFQCTAVIGLGSCFEYYSPQVEVGKFNQEEESYREPLSRLRISCGADSFVSAFHFEFSDGGRWSRYRYFCCKAGGSPTVVQPQVLKPPGGLDGTYCPTSKDASGRLVYQDAQGRKLAYNGKSGKWCIGGSCSQVGDSVVPLKMSGSDFEVVPMSNFDMEIGGAPVEEDHATNLARALKVPKPKKPTMPKMPELEEFKAEMPTYTSECLDYKDLWSQISESYKDPEGFPIQEDSKIEVDEATKDKDMAEYHPCEVMKQQGGIFGELGGGDGSKTSENMLYDEWAKCLTGDIEREYYVAKANMRIATRDFVEHFQKMEMNLYCQMMPSGEVAPMGMGIEIDVGDACEALHEFVWDQIDAVRAFKAAKWEMGVEQEGYDACHSGMVGFPRLFCDLHCTRDAVIRGDRAIIRNLETATRKTHSNMKQLAQWQVDTATIQTDWLAEKIDHSQEVSTNLLKVIAKQTQPGDGSLIQETSGRMMQEVRAMAQAAGALYASPRTKAVVQDALLQFLQSPDLGQQANNSEALAFVQRLDDLHVSLQGAAAGTKRSDVVFRQIAGDLRHLQKRAQVQLDLLGVYQQERHESKDLSSAGQISMELQGIERHSILVSMDQVWWQLRNKLDQYVEAAEDETRSFQNAFTDFENYQACSSSFSDLMMSYSAAMASMESSHRQLRSTWREASNLFGELVSMAVDGEAFSTFRQRDGCNSPMVAQTLKQAQAAMRGLRLLQLRFQASGLGEPDQTVLKQALQRLSEAHREAMAGCLVV